MTRRRWIADEVHGDIAVLLGEHATHLSRVLRAQIGQEFEIATGDSVRIARITSVADDRIELSLGAELAAKPAASLTLALAIFKFDRLEWAIEKCTEIGVSRIIPVVARRTDSHLAAAAVKRHERWQRLTRQAAEQSRRASPPEIDSPAKLTNLSDLISQDSTRIVLSEVERDARLRDVLDAQWEATLAIGPEGGWAEDELTWFEKSGWKPASLGDSILRAETAAIVATALAIDALRR